MWAAPAQDSRVALMLLCGAGILVRLTVVQRGNASDMSNWSEGTPWLGSTEKGGILKNKIKSSFTDELARVDRGYQSQTLWDWLWISTTALTQSFLFPGVNGSLVGYLFCVVSPHTITLLGKNEFRKQTCAFCGVSWRSQWSAVEISPQNLPWLQCKFCPLLCVCHWQFYHPQEHNSWERSWISVNLKVINSLNK